MTFPCTKCGLCCQNIGEVAELQQWDIGNGSCKHFDQAAGCKIYAERPLVCRIDEGYQMFKHQFSSKQDFYIANAEICNDLQESNGLSSIFRVNL